VTPLRRPAIPTLLSDDKSDQATAAEARNFQAASQSLDKLLDQFGELNFTEAYDELLHVSTSHAAALLTRIDGSFEARRLYSPSGNFNLWTGQNAPTLAGTRRTMPKKCWATWRSAPDIQQYAALASLW